jgi:hypothetical protein
LLRPTCELRSPPWSGRTARRRSGDYVWTYPTTNLPHESLTFLLLMTGRIRDAEAVQTDRVGVEPAIRYQPSHNATRGE